MVEAALGSLVTILHLQTGPPVNPVKGETKAT